MLELCNVVELLVELVLDSRLALERHSEAVVETDLAMQPLLDMVLRVLVTVFALVALAVRTNGGRLTATGPVLEPFVHSRFVFAPFVVTAVHRQILVDLVGHVLHEPVNVMPLEVLHPDEAERLHVLLRQAEAQSDLVRRQPRLV